MRFEPVFVAANTRQCDFIERLLEEKGIGYEIRPEAIPYDTSRVCYLGVLYEVPVEQAESLRKLLEQVGLAAGIIAAS